MISLAVKYRPTRFEDVSEQESVRVILENQINTHTIKNGYLFTGGAGTGKTTCARIFASMINEGKGVPIELDAASNNSVDDIRTLTEDAQTQSIDSEYKVFIIDECHSLSSQAWQAMLKTLEEPPEKSIFIFCTTNPEKIPGTILSRVQRFNFKRISQAGIVKRLHYICDKEAIDMYGSVHDDAIEYIARVADGGMRDAITLMDKCLSFSPELTVENVVSSLGLSDYETMFDLLDNIVNCEKRAVINRVNKVYSSGVDLKLFFKSFYEFILDINVYRITRDLSNTKIPVTYEINLHQMGTDEHAICKSLLEVLLPLLNDIKWEVNPKMRIVANLLIFMEDMK